MKIVVARRARRNIRIELEDMGIKESTIFPDLGGLCTDNRRISDMRLRVDRRIQSVHDFLPSFVGQVGNLRTDC